MSRLDNTISEIAYILGALMAYRQIEESGSCNDCASLKGCRYAPEAGTLVRHNCPFYERKDDGRD